MLQCLQNRLTIDENGPDLMNLSHVVFETVQSVIQNLSISIYVVDIDNFTAELQYRYYRAN